VSQAGVIHSEWIKLRSLRSTWYSLLATFAIIVGFGALFSWLHTTRQPAGNQVVPIGTRLFDTTAISLRGVMLAQLAVGVLGVLVITGEYTTGMIRSSLAAAPRRHPVLIAKSLVFAITVLVVSAAGTFVAFFLGQQLQTATHQQSTLATPGALRAIVACALYLTLIGLAGIGLGFVIRNTAGAIATLFGIVLVAPILVAQLPDPYNTDLGRFMPLNAMVQAMATLDYDSTLFSPWVCVLVVVGWAVLALIAGLVMLLRHDA